MIVKSADLDRINALSVVDTECIKVLHLINGEHFSGAERVQDLLAINLPAFGYSADFACIRPDKFSTFRESDTSVFDVPMRSNFDFRCVRRIANIVQKNGYSLIHAHTPRSLLVAAFVSKLCGLPLVYHVHSPVGRDSTRSLRNRINTFVETWCLKSVDQMICVSNSLGRYMKELGHSKSKISVVSNGVPAIENLPERSSPQGTWTIGTMALFRPRKGVEVLLDALAMLRDCKMDVHLRAVGPFETPEYESEIMNHVERLGLADQITWTGFQKDINAQLEHMDLFVLPSLFGEGLPMVVLEAMAASVPVVASRVEGIPEAIRDQVDGLIFTPGSASDLAEKIGSIYGQNERWLEMSRSTVQHQREHLSAESMASGVAKVYAKALK